MTLSLRLCGVAAATLLFPACATVTRGTQEQFAIVSEPPEADVALSTGQTCRTPCKLKLKRKTGFTATFTKEGYEPLQAEVTSKVMGGGAVAGAGNILLGGVVGAVVDGSNGSLNDLRPNPLKVQLVPTGQASAATAPAAPADAAAKAAPAPATPSDR